MVCKKMCIGYKYLSIARSNTLIGDTKMKCSKVTHMPNLSLGHIPEPNTPESEPNYQQEVADLLSSKEQEKEQTTEQFILGYN
ncbi:hypothetical protein JL49_19985 [Pseudoalteromonas luteoviolacea]|nr:hypothetical protein JL49_19985 [Pseudoalteromonas luteoviolacea]